MSKCSTRHRKTDQGTENRAVDRGPLGAVTVNPVPESAFSSLPFVYFTLFLFSFKWGHCKTRIACYPSEPFISGILPKSLEVCWKNRTPHKTLKKASCFNILRGNWIRLLVKGALVLDLRTMKWDRQSSGSLYCPSLPFSVDLDHFHWRAIYTVNCVLQAKESNV